MIGVPPTPARPSVVYGNAQVGLTASVQSNSGSAVTKWQVVKKAGDNPWETSWQDIDNSAGNSLSTTVTDLANDTTYRFKVRAVNGRGASPASAESAAVTPASRTLTASTVEDDTATLSIANHAGTWYYKKTVPSTPAGTCTKVSSETTVSLSSLTPGTSYTYKAYNDSSCTTELTSSTTDADFLTKPAQVSGVTVTPLSGSLKVSWTAASGTVAGYKVQWKSTGQYGSTNQVTPTGTSHTISSLTNGTQYSIRVAATNTTGDGDWSSDATGTPAAVALTASTVEDDTATLEIAHHAGSWYYKKTAPAPAGACTEVSSGTTASLSSLTSGTSYTYKAYSDSSCNTELTSATFLTKPAKVGNVTVIPLSGSLKVSWTAASGTVAGYKVQWKSTGQYGSTNQATSTGTSHTIPNLTDGTHYTVRVAATNGTGDGDWSSDATGTPGMLILIASMVEDDTATLTIANHTAIWYYKKTTPTPAGSCTLVSSGTTASLSSLTSGTSYTYKAYSDSSCQTELTTNATDAEFLTMPGQVSGVTVATDHQSLGVSWTAVTGTVTYTVQWKSGGQIFSTTRQKTNISTTSTDIENLANNTNYTFRVRATNTTGDGDWSATATGTPRTITFAASEVGETSAKLNLYVHIAPSLQIGIEENGFWVTHAGVSQCTKLDYNNPVVTNLIGGKTYTYRTYGSLKQCTGFELATVSFTTLPPKPTKPTLINLAGDKIRLSASVTSPAALTKWQYQRKVGENEFEAGWNDILSTSQTLSHTVSGLTEGTAYKFKVRAVNVTGHGAASDASDALKPQAVALTASAVEDDTATLSIANHTGTWYYKYTVPTTPAGTCTEVSSGTTASLSSLTPGTSYTYKAYSDSSCDTELTSATKDADFLTKPAQVSGVTVTLLSGSLKVSWTAVTSATGYKVQWKSNGEYGSTNQATPTGASHTIPSLTNGTQYSIRVAATNGTGDGDWSSDVTGTPAAVALTASTVEDDTATLEIAHHAGSWYYKKTAPAPAGSCTEVSSGTTASLSSLTPGTSYTYKAYSDSSCNTELTSASTDAEFLTKPAQVSDVTVTTLSGSLQVSWTAVTSATGYKLQWKSTGEYGSTNQATPTGASYTIPSLTNGSQYSIRVAATNGTGDGDWSSDATGTPAPVSLTASAVEDDTATLTIVHHAGTWYYKYAMPSTPAGTCTEVSSGTTVSLSSLIPGTSYTYKAYSDSGCNTELTSATTDAEFLTKPAQVSGVTVTTLSGSLKVSWTAPTGTVTGYKVQWRSGSEYQSGDDATSTGTSHTIPSLTNGTKYTIRVAATNATGDGDWSAEAAGTPAAVTLTAIRRSSGVSGELMVLTIANHAGTWYYKKTVPSTPAGACTEVSNGTTASLIDLTPGTSYTFKAYSDSTCGTELTSATTDADFLTKPAQVSGVTVTTLSSSLQVSWTAVTGATGYKVQWKSGDEKYDTTRQNMVSGGSTTTSTITNLTNDTSYSIQVAATNAAGDGDWSSDATGTPGAVALTASTVEDDTATLSIANHEGSWYYKYTVPTGGTCAEVSSGTTASLSSLTPGTSYTYKAYSDSSCNNELTSATTDADFLTKPAQVSGVTVTALNGSLKVSWTAVTSATGYKVQWKSAGEYGSTNQATPTGTSHTIPSLTNGTQYSIRVAATNATGDGDWSSDATGTPGAVALTASTVEDDTATLSIANHEGSWYYKYTVPTGGSCTEVSSGTTASLSSLTPGTSYTYKAYSDSTCGTELTSSTTDAEFLTKPAQVSGVTVTPLSGSLKVTWTAVTSATGYKVQWKSTGEYGSTNQATPTGTSHTIPSLTNGTQYSIRVAATNATGDGDWSSDATGTPGAVALTASTVEDDTATLSIANHEGSWYYKYTVPTGGSCTEVSSGTTASLSSLTPGTSYTYKAYSDSSCNNELTTATTDADFLTKPAQVSGVTVTALSGSLKVTWTAATGTVTGYKVQWKSAGEYGSTNQATPTGTSHTIPSLTNGTQYSIRVAATNATGDGDWSSDATGTPVAVALTASTVEDDTATLSIANHTGSWYYKYTVPTGGTCTEVSSGTTASLSSLTPGTSYTYKAYSDSTCGTELTSSSTDAEFLTKPAQVSGVTVTPLSGSLKVSWTAVTSATGYTVQWKSTGEYGSTDQATPSSTSHTIPSLTNGTQYSIRVAATNATGDGDWSSDATGIPAAVALTASTVEDDTATLSIANHTGSWYYKYTVPTGGTCTEVSSGTTANLSSLTPGTSYTFKAYSDNSCNNELTSATTDADFLTKPAQVSSVTVTPLGASLKVTWTAVTSATGYTVQWKSSSDSGWDATNRQATSTNASATISSLTNGTTYTVRVAAVNASGNGAWSDTATGTPSGAYFNIYTRNAGGASFGLFDSDGTFHSETWYSKVTPAGKRDLREECLLLQAVDGEEFGHELHHHRLQRFELQHQTHPHWTSPPCRPRWPV